MEKHANLANTLAALLGNRAVVIRDAVFGDNGAEFDVVVVEFTAAFADVDAFDDACRAALDKADEKVADVWSDADHRDDPFNVCFRSEFDGQKDTKYYLLS